MAESDKSNKQGDQIGQCFADWVTFGSSLGFFKVEVAKEMATFWATF